METSVQDLIAAAVAAREQAYAPYSRFRVGAALIDEHGDIHTGCNIENASYGATCCAERVAVFKAIAAGRRQIRLIAVVSDQPEPCVPCGICRQVLAEFAAADFRLLAAQPAGPFIEMTLNEMLPHAFRLESRG